jgi:MFS family permease
LTDQRVVRRALADGDILAAQTGFACFSIVEHGTWLALLLYAFDRGGVGEAGLVAFFLLIPAALTAPFAAVIADRLPLDLALAVGYGLQAIAAALTAGAMYADAPAVVVYPLAALFVSMLTVSRPTISAVLPAIASGPAELAAANSMSGFVETVSAFIGPGVAGVVLVSGSPAAVFALSAALLMAAVGLSLTMTPRPFVGGDSFPSDDERSASALSEILGGLSLLRAERAPRLLVIMMAGTWMVFGALDVAFIAVAVEQLQRSEASAGLLGSALGIGGILGALASFALVGRRRLSMPTALGLLAMGLPIMAIAGTDSLAVVALLLVASGAGEAVADVAARTLLQGLAAEDTLARVFGVVEGLATAALALGSVGFSVIAVVAGLEAALVVTGAILPLFLVLRFRALREIDRRRPELDPLLLNLVRSIPIFAPLPAFRLEQLLVNLRAKEIEPGQVVFSKGELGDLFYLVAAGSAVVELEHRNAVHERGGFFGEIALVRNQPRMATVRAGDDGLVVYTLERKVFLEAITAFAVSHSRTLDVADRRLRDR